MKGSAIQAAVQQTANVLGCGVDFATRTVYVHGEINDETAQRFVTGFHQLDQTPGPIRIWLSSPGGSEPAGYTIYDTIREARNVVVIDAYGMAQSIAALILQAGQVRRLSTECRFMVHSGHIELGHGVDTRTLAALGGEAAKGNLRYQEVLARRSGRSVADVKQMCETETYLSADEAVKAGFADSVISYDEPLAVPMPSSERSEPARSRRKPTKKRRK